jgi:ABC-type sugar transport system ATPase subunit
VAAVDHVSFAVRPGELVGFLGLNGAGKTTTLRILTTFMPASSGIARVAGFDVMYQSMEVRQHLGYLPESVPLYPEMRVDEYLTARAKLKQVDRTVRTARIDHCESAAVTGAPGGLHRAYVRERVLLVVRLGNLVHPVRALGVREGGDDRRGVVGIPWPERHDAVREGFGRQPHVHRATVQAA